MENDCAKPTENDDATPTENDGAKPTENYGAKSAENDAAKPTENEDAKSTENDGANPTENDGATPTENDGLKSMENEGAKLAEHHGVTPTENEGAKLTENHGTTSTENDSAVLQGNSKSSKEQMVTIQITNEHGHSLEGQDKRQEQTPEVEESPEKKKCARLASKDQVAGKVQFRSDQPETRSVSGDWSTQQQAHQVLDKDQRTRREIQVQAYQLLQRKRGNR